MQRVFLSNRCQGRMDASIHLTHSSLFNLHFSFFFFSSFFKKEPTSLDHLLMRTALQQLSRFGPHGETAVKCLFTVWENGTETTKTVAREIGKHRVLTDPGMDPIQVLR